MFRFRTVGAVGLLALLCISPLPAAGDGSGTSSPEESVLVGFDQSTTELNELASRVHEVAVAFPEAAGPLSLDYNSHTVVVRYVASSSTAGQFLDALKALPSGSMTVSPVKVEYSERDLAGAAIRLHEEPQFANEVFGQVPVSVGYTPEGLDITVRSTGEASRRAAVAAETAAEKVLGVPTKVSFVEAATGLKSDVEGYQSSTTDASPWTGGLRLVEPARSASTWCTGGFVWQKWTTQERMVSTAEHCYQLEGVSSWRTGALALPITDAVRSVGQRYYYSVAADTALL